MKAWQLQEAKAKFSELVKLANTDGPQNITVHGKSAVVVISKTTYDQLTKPKISLVKFLRKSPLMGLKLDLKRNKSYGRDIEL
ncbi:MAG: prevent-host-death protein [Gammaproteobacteria bacterium RIFCSPHIGHO2_12_FULL_35_23]|nr:MAG: prevent-host-death protein [Gammaproteobacteria bacterium RIFCSPHIGHO2_12_FULL_35_23]